MAPLTYEAVKGGWKAAEVGEREGKNDKKIGVATTK